MNTTNTVEMAIANIAATSEMLEKMSNDSNRRLSPYAANLLERMSWELHKLAGDLSEINYNYVS
jgi:ATP-dependent protease HslVU (ClpYQ) ATPase subunit